MHVARWQTFLFSLIIVLFFWTVSSAKTEKKVLLLNSYHYGYKWTDDITKSVREILTRDNGIDLRVEYLDSKRYFSEKYFQQQLGHYQKKYSQTRFDVILCTDNNALSFLIEYRQNIFSGIPIVFCGVNFFKPEILKGEKGITGVNESIDFARTIEMMLAMNPDANRLVVINDETVTGKILSKDLMRVVKEYPQIEWDLTGGLTIEGLQSKLEKLQRGDLVLLSLFLKDAAGRYFEFDEATEIISRSSPVPVYGVSDFSLGYGIAGGYLTSGANQGIKAADMVLKVLSGIHPDNIPVLMESPNKYFADYQVLKKFALQKVALPEGTIVINRPPDFYEEHKLAIWSAIFVIALFATLSLFLSLSILRKKKVERELLALTAELESRVMERTKELASTNLTLADREEQMSHLLSNISGMVYRCRNDTQWTMLFVSEGAAKLTGYGSDDLLYNNTIAFTDLIYEKDKETVVSCITEAIRTKRPFAVEYRIVTKGMELKWVWEQGMAVYDAFGEVRYLDGIITDITERKLMELEQTKLATAVHQTDDLVFITDPDGKIEYANPAFTQITGYTLNEVIGCNPRILKSGRHPMELYEDMWQNLLAGKVWRGRLNNKRKDGSEYTAEATISPIRNQQKELINYVAVQRDITHEIVLENNLRQAQKLEAMGTLAGGIAHEINTPAQFVTSNLDFIQESFSDLVEYLEKCGECSADGEMGSTLIEELQKIHEANDIDYLIEEIPQALDQSLEGIRQISHIVLSMKQFAHPGEENMVETDINEALKNTVTVCSNEWKYVAQVEFQLDPELPHVSCNRSELNQVFLNLIVNAAHAMEESGYKEDTRGRISIVTGVIDNNVEITVADNGGGIPAAIRERIFDPFFTTKEPGRGTGQGLSIAHSIITEKYKGQLFFEVEEGVGTTFHVTLPLMSHGEVDNGAIG